MSSWYSLGQMKRIGNEFAALVHMGAFSFRLISYFVGILFFVFTPSRYLFAQEAPDRFVANPYAAPEATEVPQSDLVMQNLRRYWEKSLPNSYERFRYRLLDREELLDDGLSPRLSVWDGISTLSWCVIPMFLYVLSPIYLPKSMVFSGDQFVYMALVYLARQRFYVFATIRKNEYGGRQNYWMGKFLSHLERAITQGILSNHQIEQVKNWVTSFPEPVGDENTEGTFSSKCAAILREFPK